MTDYGDGSFSSITPDGQGGTIVFWLYLSTIRAQRLSPGGARMWNPNGIGVGGGALADYAIASDGNGGAFVAWFDWHREPGRPGLYAQHVSGSGQITWNLRPRLSGTLWTNDRGEYWLRTTIPGTTARRPTFTSRSRVIASSAAWCG